MITKDDFAKLHLIKYLLYPAVILLETFVLYKISIGFNVLIEKYCNKALSMKLFLR